MAALSASIPAGTRVITDRSAGQLFFLDNLRIFATAVVIIHHVGQAYGPTGGEWPVGEAVRSAVLGPFFAVNRSFGMSLFFFVAGYFMVRSYDRHGAAPFVRSRLVRLGLPLLVFLAISYPLLLVWASPSESSGGALPQPNALHLWFVEHLLLFSLVYAAGRSFVERRRAAAGLPPALLAPARPLPGLAATLLFALVLSLVTFAVRLWSPIDHWLNLLGFIRVAFADVPRDLAFFTLGALAFRNDWLTRFSSRAGRTWLAAGLILAASWYAWDLSGLALAVTPGEPPNHTFYYPVWESFLCTGMVIGLLVLFRDFANRQTRLTAELGRSQYLAYILHIIPVLAVQALAVSLPLPPFAKFVLVSLAAAPLAFAFASLLRRPLRL
jgi:glucans biosynthesis protein C